MASDNAAVCGATVPPPPPLIFDLKYTPAPTARASATAPTPTHLIGNFFSGSFALVPDKDSDVTTFPENTEARSPDCPLALDRGRLPSNVSRSSMISWMLL